MKDLFRRWNLEIKRFEKFLRTVPVPDRVETNVGTRFHQPHVALRPSELFAQKRLAHWPFDPDCIEQAASGFGRDLPLIAFLSFIDLAFHHNRLHNLQAAEFLMLANPPGEFPELASRFLVDRLEGSPEVLSDLTPAGVPLINLLATSTFGEPTGELLDAVVRWFGTHTEPPTYPRGPIAIAIGTLLWRALDAGHIGNAAMYQLVHIEPDLLRTLESDSLHAGTRLSAEVPPGSPTEALLEQICLERLDSFGGGRPIAPTSIKSIPLWPGTDVLLAALDALERVRRLTPDELRDGAPSMLWHVFRHTRRATAQRIDRSRLNRYSDSSLVQAAIVAPWYSTDIEAAVALPGLTDLVTWAHAHSRAAMRGSDPSPELPRVSRQIAALVEDHGLVGEGERDEGVFDRDWLLTAVNRPGEDRLGIVKQTIHLACRHRTYLAESIDAILGRNTADVWSGSREQNQHLVRMLGLLPGTASDIRERLVWLAAFASDSEALSAQKRVLHRRAAFVGATNLAWADGVADAMLLAWHHGHPGLMGEGLDVPLTLDRHEVRLGADGFGDPTTEVVTRSSKQRPLKGIPREVAAHPGFRTLRARIRDLDGFLAAFRATCERRLLMGYELSPATMHLLLEHPVMGRMIGACVFTDGEVDGFPVLDGQSIRLEDDGELRSIRRNAEMVMVHPIDLLEDETLDAWRDQLVRRGWTQPVPQLFREIPSPPIRGAARLTNEYSGHRVGVVSTVELLGASGWIAGTGQHPRRYYPDSELIACWPFSDRPSAELLNHPLATTGPLSFLDAATREVLPLADVPDHVLSDASRDCVRVIATCSVPRGPAPLPVINARHAFLQRLVAREEADDAGLPQASRVVTEVTRGQLVLRVPGDPSQVTKNSARKNSSGEPDRDADGGVSGTARIDLMTGELRIGDDPLHLALFDDAASIGSFPHRPEPALDRLVRTWLGVRAGVASGNSGLLDAFTR